MRDTEKLRKRIFEIVQIGNHPDLLSIAFDIFITVVIALNLFVTLYSTFDSSVRFAGLLKAIELLTILIFTAEYILRLWTAKYLYPKLSDVTAACRFVFSFFGLIDLLSILTYDPSGISDPASLSDQRPVRCLQRDRRCPEGEKK